jgi:hypothetical protein
VQPCEHAPDLSFASFMVLDGARHDQQLIESFGRTRRLVWELPPHRGERDEDFVDVPPVVTRVLFLGRHHADNSKGNVIEIDELPEGGAATE